jgi:hypothetical protein
MIKILFIAYSIMITVGKNFYFYSNVQRTKKKVSFEVNENCNHNHVFF